MDPLWAGNALTPIQMWIVVILAYGDGVQGAVTGVLKVRRMR